MKLMYRGIPYEASLTQESAADIAETQSSRRAISNKKDSPKEQLRHPGQELTYRGVRYTP